MNILIVDDIEDNIDSLERLMKQFSRKKDIHFNFFRAQNGQVAINICNDNEIDLIFMDIVMPVMNGLEATKIIKLNHPKIMIVAVSSEKQDSTIQEILNNGAEDYVNKPFNSSVMLTRLDNYTKLINSRNSIGYQTKAINVFTHKIYSYQINFFISNEDELAQFWETMLVRLEFQEHVEHLSDFVRFIFQIGAVQLKKSYKFNIYVEEDNDYFYFTMNNMKLLPIDYLNKISEKSCKNAIINLKDDLMSFALPRVDETLLKDEVKPIEDTSTYEEIKTVVEIKKEVLNTYEILDVDELDDFEFVLSKLKTEITMMGTTDLNIDDIDTINENIHKLANILSSSSDAYNISSSLNDLCSLLNEYSDDFLLKSKDLSDLMSSFLNDLIMWKKMVFYTGAPSVNFLDDSIISNVQMVRAMLIVDENISDDLDDIFDF